MAQGHGDGQLHLHATGEVLEGLFLRQAEAGEVILVLLSVPTAVGLGHDASHLKGIQALWEIGLVQHHESVRQALDKPPHLLAGADDGGGVARVAENQQLHALLPAGLDGAVHIDGIIRPLGDGDVAGLLQIAVEGVHGEVRLQGGEGLPLLEEPGEQHGNQLVGAVACGHVFHRHAVILGKGLAQLLGGGVRVAVESHLGHRGGQLL